MAKYRKKPVVIEAFQYTGINAQSVENFMGSNVSAVKRVTDGNGFVLALEIHTLEGVMRADKFDWVIKGVNGEFYPCKPDIFEKTYELVSD